MYVQKPRFIESAFIYYNFIKYIPWDLSYNKDNLKFYYVNWTHIKGLCSNQYVQTYNIILNAHNIRLLISNKVSYFIIQCVILFLIQSFNIYCKKISINKTILWPLLSWTLFMESIHFSPIILWSEIIDVLHKFILKTKTCSHVSNDLMKKYDT